MGRSLYVKEGCVCSVLQLQGLTGACVLHAVCCTSLSAVGRPAFQGHGPLKQQPDLAPSSPTRRITPQGSACERAACARASCDPVACMGNPQGASK